MAASGTRDPASPEQGRRSGWRESGTTEALLIRAVATDIMRPIKSDGSNTVDA